MVALKPGESVQREFDVAAPATAVGAGINRMRILTQVVPAQKTEEFAETFFAPAPLDSSSPPASGGKP